MESLSSANPSSKSTSFAAVGTALLFYLFCVLALGWIWFVLSFYLVGCLAAIYVIGGLLPAMNAMGRLSGIVMRGLRLRDGPDWYMPLRREDAPDLYALTEQLAARIGVEPPQQISVEMSADASIALYGNRTGQGKSRLYLGYDLITVLTRDELASIIAHELAHCKFVVRAHQSFCFRGLACADQLREDLETLLKEYEYRKTSFHTASLLYRCLIKLMRFMNRAFAAASRTDELQADSQAAKCAGSDVFGGALLKMGIAISKRESIDWRDRRVFGQRSDSFSEWLRGKLTPVDIAERRRMEQWLLASRADTEFATHPPLADRLAALPPVHSHSTGAEPALALLKNADEIADAYMRHADSIVRDLERKATSSARKTAAKKAKRVIASDHYTRGQAIGVAAIVLGCFTLIVAVCMLCCLEFGAVLVTSLIACAFLGSGCWMAVRYARREMSPLPAPPFELWLESLRSDQRQVPPDEWRAETAREVLALLPPSTRGKGRRSAFWAEVCYSMLAKCDMRSALVASEYCLAEDRFRLEGLLAQSIALAWLGNVNDSYAAMNVAYGAHRFGKSMGWGFGWAFALCGNWVDAEIYFLNAADARPDDATIMAALSVSQRRQGKLLEATDSARSAVAMAPRSVEIRKTLVSTLLDDGQWRDALTELETISGLAADDPDVMLMNIYAHAICGDLAKSRQFAERAATMLPKGKTYLRIAQAFEDAGCTEECRIYCNRALDVGFYPEALYALALAECRANELTKARELLTSALNCTTQLADGSVGVLAMIEPICTLMLSLEYAPRQVKGYSVRMLLKDSPLDANSMDLLICAETSEEARHCARRLYSAMLPGREPAEHTVFVDELVSDLQPKEPVASGIHGVQFD